VTVTLYGIKTCGTVKKARAWLDQHGVAYTWVDFRQTPLPCEVVAAFVATLGSKVMRNTSGGSYRTLGNEKKDWTDAQWLPRFQADSMLLKRPLLAIDGVPAAVGFKPDAYARLFAKDGAS